MRFPIDSRVWPYPAPQAGGLVPNDKGRRRRFGAGLVFVGARGGVLRRNNFRRIWLRALAATGLGDVHFHDLRHTGNTLAATGGASTRELMHRMGHSSVRTALIYQHLVNGRDHVIADYVDGRIRKVKRPPHGPSGT
ncbi:tyrosine-type recombinase/integrase [Streptomyces sp. NPDC058297]|uniref:tyrosine-type recombinase/integrase n=1 Tax=Streptomyces sp. NPDC058297 TaxID=3346433 RepID=UPI0036EF1BE1